MTIKAWSVVDTPALVEIIGGAIARKNTNFSEMVARREVVQAVLDDLAASGWSLLPPASQ